MFTVQNKRCLSRSSCSSDHKKNQQQLIQEPCSVLEHENLILFRRFFFLEHDSDWEATIDRVNARIARLLGIEDDVYIRTCHIAVVVTIHSHCQHLTFSSLFVLSSPFSHSLRVDPERTFDSSCSSMLLRVSWQLAYG